jgi:hypothetical protein
MNPLKLTLSFLMILLIGTTLTASGDSTEVKKEEPKWYQSISLRGYTQVRYNRLLETNPKLKCDQCDKSWGENGGFFIRRIRLIFSGNVHDRVFMYIQPDLASSASSSGLHFAQIRDAYFDLALDKNKTTRLRFGQSKVPFGFENLQSSQNRLPLDRNDGINSALSNERDLGVFLYWAPKKIRERFAYLISSGLKGSGDYGVFGFGAHNGQTANRPEANNDPTIVGRLTYPFLIFGKQIIEPGIQAYTGQVILQDRKAKGINKEYNYKDERVAASFVLYPQPFGIQTEWNVGTGPEYDPVSDTIRQLPLRGGYFQCTYMIKVKDQIIFPFFRTQYYNGGKKHETDARRYIVKENEFGIEWQPFRNFELVAMYTMSDRTFEDSSNKSNHQKGNLLRLQVQFNY